MVSEKDRSIILNENSNIIYDRLNGFDDIINPTGSDTYDNMISDIIELKTLAACYRYNLEDWAEDRLNKWKGTRKDILKQIYTILQGFKV